VNDLLLFKRLIARVTFDPGASPLFAGEQGCDEKADESALSKL